jgi:CDP-2,3-bis-(O-geranylgeranyl)-sn-glycerol synthase
MSPVLLKWLPFGGKPISECFFGGHKTWRGLIVAPVVGLLIFSLQKLIYASGWQKLALLDYNGFPYYFGFLLGTGAILGDLVKSYYKRKAGIKPGDPWVPADQLDFVIGGLLFSFFLYVPPPEVALIIVICSFFLHIIVNYCGYLLRINERKM